MAVDQGGRMIAPRLAGVVVLVDGLLALAGAGLFLLLSVFPPVAAIEGAPPSEQSWILQALVSLAVAVAALWAGQRAIRGIRRGRFLGAGVAGLVGLLIGWVLVTGDAGLTAGTVAWAIVVLVELAAAAVLVSWRGPDRPVSPRSVEAA